jgi:DNA polymerase III delta prime subunit
MIIDEAEQMSLKAQAALKIIIEQTSENCRFIFITNDITKIDEAIKSRLKVICFDQIPSQASKIIEDYKKRTVEKMKLKNQEMNLEEIEELNDIIVKNYPDYRKIANEMEFAFN